MPARARKPRASSGNVTRPKVTEVDVKRAPEAAVLRALDLAGGDKKRLSARLEPDGRVSVLVLNHPRKVG